MSKTDIALTEDEIQEWADAHPEHQWCRMGKSGVGRIIYANGVMKVVDEWYSDDDVREFLEAHNGK